MERSGTSESTTAALIIFGVLIGAGIVLGTLQLTGRPYVETSTTYVTVTSTTYFTSTLVVTTTSVLSEPQVSIVRVALSHPTVANVLTAMCASSAGSAGFIELSNYGNANTIASFLSLTYGGVTYSTTLSGACTVPAGGTLYLQIAANALGGTGTAGQQFSGFVTISDGAEVVFTGAFT